MHVEQIKDVTTRESAITYELKIRISTTDMREDFKDFRAELALKTLKAINGLAQYGYFENEDYYAK